MRTVVLDPFYLRRDEKRQPEQIEDGLCLLVCDQAVDRLGTGFRRTVDSPLYRRTSCLLARESMRFYADAPELLSMRVDPGFRACGYLFLAHSDRVFARMRENVALQNELGIRSRIVGPAEAAELVPGLEVAGVVGGA